MIKKHWVSALAAVVALTAAAGPALAQVRPYIGYAYPAGGRQGTTFQVKLGGQGLDDVNGVLITGPGATAAISAYHRRLSFQEMQLLNEQLKELKPKPAAQGGGEAKASGPAVDEPTRALIDRLEQRIAGFVPTPACASLASIVLIDVTLAADAPVGARELRLVTPRGVTNPLVFHVDQLPEVSRPAMKSATLQVLGKEEAALRKRPADEVEQRIALPCIVNGQIASGEVNRYRFEAKTGQHLVFAVKARSLVPYIADAVPGWFQPVLAVYDADGKELAYNDDYRFHPDPTILFEAPRDGEFVFTITDAIYRGREDFVYRVAVGELPFVTGVFPLGASAGSPAPTIAMTGWNLDGAEWAPPAPDAAPGVHSLAARGRDGLISNSVPFALGETPEVLENEPNDDHSSAQTVGLPIVVNGRVDRPDDWDVYQFQGRAGETVCVEVEARRLGSPLDSMIKLTDAAGAALAVADDDEGLIAGAQTHQADSYLMTTLPADGVYFAHLGDAARFGGADHAYRLRISAPRPDFALRVAPSSVTLRSKSTAALNVYAVRKDGFDGPIRVTLSDPPEGLLAARATIPAGQSVARLAVRTTLTASPAPLALRVEGAAMIEGREVVRRAEPAEDRMQAFLWRHLVPAQDLWGVVFDPAYEPPLRRADRPRTTPPPAAVSSDAPPKFSKQQVAGRLRQLKLLYNEELLTDEFYDQKVAECEAVQ